MWHFYDGKMTVKFLFYIGIFIYFRGIKGLILSWQMA